MLASLFPGYRAWQERRQVMRELQTMREREEAQLALSDQNPVERAKVALRVDDPEVALQCWQEALERFPDFAKKSHDSLEVLLGLKRYDEADALMLEGQKRSPMDPFYQNGYALVAERKRDYAEGARRWEKVRKKLPTHWRGWVHGAVCLRELGRLDEADKLLDRALTMFPDRFECRLEKARTAESRGDWPAAIQLWEHIITRYQHSAGQIGVAHALTKMGRADEAEERLKAARMLTPLVVEIPLALARLAQDRGDLDEAVRRWIFVRERFPLMPFGYEGALRLLNEMQRYDEAEAVTLEAMDRFPAEAWPATEYARIADRRKDWEAAVARWQRVREQWPKATEAYRQEAQALDALGRSDEAAEVRAALGTVSA